MRENGSAHRTTLTRRPLMGTSCLGRSGNSLGDLNRVRLSPDRLSAAKVEAVHGGLQVGSIHLAKQEVMVDFFVLERVAGSAFNRIGVSSRATRYKIGDTAVLMAFVIVYVSGKDDEPSVRAWLGDFQHIRYPLSGVARP